MTILTDTPRDGYFLISEANGQRSRAAGVATAVAMVSGTIVGQITAGGAYVAHTDAAVDGSQVVAGVWFNNTPAAGGAGVLIERDAEVQKSLLVYDPAANAAAILVIDAALAGLGIIAKA